MTFKVPRVDLPVLLGQRAHGRLLAAHPSPRLRSSAPPLLPTPPSPRNAPITAAEANGRAGGQPRWSPLLLTVARQPPRRPRARTCRRKTLSGFSAPRPPRNERSSSVPSALARSSPDVGFSLVCRQAPGLEAARVELSVYERWRDRTRSENTGWGGGPLQPACPLPAAGSSARGHAGCVLAVSVP